MRRTVDRCAREFRYRKGLCGRDTAWLKVATNRSLEARVAADRNFEIELSDRGLLLRHVRLTMSRLLARRCRESFCSDLLGYRLPLSHDDQRACEAFISALQQALPEDGAGASVLGMILSGRTLPPGDRAGRLLKDGITEIFELGSAMLHKQHRGSAPTELRNVLLRASRLPGKGGL